jgi:hypothetical protein
MVTLAVLIHRLASVTVTIYVPAARPVAVAVVCTGKVFHEYAYGPTPPAGVAVAVPVDDPLHNTLTCVVPTVSATGWVIVTLAVLIHRLASVTVTIYVPAARPVAVAVVCTGNVFHEYVYGPTPPAGVAVAVPVDDPLHNTLTCVVPTVSATGWVIVTLAVLIHRLASVTVTIYVPAARPVAVAVVCTGNVFHE